MSKATVANSEVEALFAAAQEALQSADISKALSHFRSILSLDSDHGMANYWLGVLAKPASIERALLHFEKAVARHPDLPDCHIELGLACRAAGMAERAETCFRTARELTPCYGQAQWAIAESFVKTGQISEAIEACVRGLLLFPTDTALLRELAGLYGQAKRWPEAVATWRQLLELQTGSESTHNAFAQACVDAGDLELAALAFKQVLELNPRSHAARLNLGVVLGKLGQHEAALDCFQCTRSLDPNNAEIHKAIGDVYGKLERWTEAEAAWRRALELRPEYADAWQNLGLGLERMNRLEEARECHQRVVALRPDDATAQRYLGMILQDLGHLDRAHQAYQTAQRIAPHDAEVHWQLFSLLAAQGAFPQAWQEHEWRWEIQNRTTPKHGFPKPRWAGEELSGRTLLLHAEQGFGDTIQAARYVPLVRQKGARVLLWAPPQLVRLLQTIPGVAGVFSQLTADKQYDFELPLMSLPLVFQTTLETIPSRVPYLEVPKDARIALPEFDPTRLKVGIVWSGSRSQPNDRRPIPLELLEPLLRMQGVEFYSLQCGEAANDLHRFPIAARVIDLSASLTDFAATGKAVEQLDLIVTIDTALAHLAGALGRRVWTLLSATPDWRWMRDREDCRWYPTMRLFRQPRAGDWAPVIENVRQALAERISEKCRSVPARAWLGKGLRHHQEDELADAEWCYQQVLAQAPEQTDALRFLGELSLRRRDCTTAQHWFRKALASAPDSPHIHYGLGLVQFELGQVDEAVGAYGKAIALQPSFPEAHYNLGNALYCLRRFVEAKAAYEQALEQNPNLADAHYNLGLIAQDQCQTAEARLHYQAALQVQPGHLDACQNLGLVLKEEGKLAEAEHCFRQMLELEPAHAQARVNLATVLLSAGRLSEAEQRCVEAIEIQPDLAEGWLNLGVARQAAGNIDGALQSLRRALELQPNNPDAEYNLAIAELLAGQYSSGWKHYEARWRTSNPIFGRQLSIPLWCGEEIAGRTVLIHAEQGYGDSLQFARYLPLAASLGARVVFECPPLLVNLMKTVAGVSEVVPTGAHPPGCDLRCPLLSLPERFRTEIATIPNQVPYLRARPSTLPGDPDLIRNHFKVGVVWFGSRNQPADRRPAPFHMVARLLETRGVLFYSLQVGDVPHEIESLVQNARIVHLGAQFADFAATAAAIHELDLVISVDTAIAHLAGALGKRVWVLLPFAPDWRWLLEREDSPWYPTMRLFRQSRPGAWEPVIERVESELKCVIQ